MADKLRLFYSLIPLSYVLEVTLQVLHASVNYYITFPLMLWCMVQAPLTWYQLFFAGHFMLAASLQRGYSVGIVTLLLIGMWGSSQLIHHFFVDNPVVRCVIFIVCSVIFFWCTQWTRYSLCVTMLVLLVMIYGLQGTKSNRIAR